MNASREQLEWALGPDTGISSLTIWSVMTDLHSYTAAGFGNSVPLDSGDFGRCFRLLQRFPHWRHRLAEVADRYPHWEVMVEHWDELERLYGESRERLYQRMRELYWNRPERA